MTRSRAVAAVLAAIAAVSLCGHAKAEPKELKLGSFGPPQSFFYVEVVIPWMKAVSADSGGTIDIRFYPDGVLGTARTMFDSVMSGAADIGWALPHAAPGKFVKSSIIELPFGYEKGEFGAVAFWRIYQNGLIASDYKGVKLFGLTAWPAAAIQTKSAKITKLETLRGLKLRVSGKLQADTVLALGATPVQVPVDQIYQAIDKGVIAGAWASLTATRAFRLTEVAKYYLDVPLNGAGGMLVMSQATFDKLPDKAKAAFDRHSGEALSRALGASNDGEVVRVKALIEKLAKEGKGHEIYGLSDAELARWKEKVEPVVTKWAQRVPNGPAILKGFRAAVADARAGH